MTSRHGPTSGDVVAQVLRDHPGSWIAWRESPRQVLAIADTAADVLKQLPDPADPGVIVAAAPGVHPRAAARPFERLADEAPNVLDDVQKYFGDGAAHWLDCPNAWFDGCRPRELLRTPEEEGIRYLLRAIKTGTPA